MEERRYEIICYFCGVQFDDTGLGWLEAVKEWEGGDSPAPTEDIVTTSKKDGDFWQRIICVGPTWDSYVSGRCAIDYFHDFLPLAFEEDSHWSFEIEEDYLTFHPQCLSYICRRNNASPQQIRKAHCSEMPSRHLQLTPGSRGHMGRVRHHDIDQFHESLEEYCVEKITPKSQSMKESQWLFARPTVFPVLSTLSTSVSFSTNTNPSMERAPCVKVFNISELFDIILDYTIGKNLSQSQLSKEIVSKGVFPPISVTQGTEAVFSLLRVNRTLYTLILRDRQTLFLRLAWMHGWMLPATPEDWKNWPNGAFHNGTVFELYDDRDDWRTYLLAFMHKEDVHIKNRFQRMAVQFTTRQSQLAYRPDVKPPQRLSWEPTGKLERY